MSGNGPRARTLFVELIETCPPSDWSGRLAEVRREDSQLADRVELLLQAHANPSQLFDDSISPITPRIDDVELVSTVIGPYHLREKIGEGGFGVVYVAEQVEPIRREVALKLIKPGMDSREVIARFEVERQTLAMMDHPHVAKVLDAGMTQNGRPYFVMELVRGQRITTFCDRMRLTIEDRLRIFVDVCRAVQHAHQKGIIHRDLKPSNILVARQDDAPVPKVIDFGVAKALTQQLRGQTVYTAFDQMIGTPMYMSPEQAEMGSLDIDTRSDVYSLGVVLYRLVSGATPYDRDSLRNSTPEQLRRILRHREPLRPSGQFANLSEKESSRVCEERRLDPRRLRNQLAGELDWIVMKAIEKDRNRRYESPTALADDIERFLEGDLVAARPPSAWYRLSKLAGHYRGAIATAAIVLVALCAGLAVAMVQRNEAVKARGLAERRLQEADRERERAEELLYVSDVQLAAQSIEQGEVQQAAALLNRHRPGPATTDRRGLEWHLLMRQVTGHTTEIALSKGPLYTLQHSPDRQWLLAAGATASVYLLDPRTLKLIDSFDTGQKEVNGLTFTKDGARLLTAGDDGTVRIWSFPAFELLQTIRYGERQVYSAILDPDEKQVFVAGREPWIGIFDFETGELLSKLTGHDREVEALEVSQDGRMLGSVSADHTMILWDLQKRKPWSRSDRRVDRLSVLAMFGGDSWIVDGGLDGTLTLTNAGTGEAEAWLSLGDPVQSLAVSADETAIVAATRGGTLHLVLIERSPFGSARTLRLATAWKSHSDRIYGVLWSGDDTVLSVARDGTLCRTRLSPGLRRGRILPGVYPQQFALSPDGRHLVWIRENQMGRIDLQTGKEVPLEGFPVGLEWSEVRYSPDGQRLFAGTLDGRLFMIPFDKPSDVRVRDLKFDHGVWELRCSKDGSLLASVSRDDDRIKVLDVPSLETRFEIALADNWRAALSEDGKLVAVNRGRDALVFELDSGQLIAESLRHHDEAIRSLAFLPGDEELATIGSDRTIRIWGWREGGRPDVVGVHTSGSPVDLQISRDGRTAVTATTQGEVVLWHLPTRQKLFSMAQTELRYRQMALSADERILATTDRLDNLRWYPLQPEAADVAAGED
ncbi:Serine/threonine-protein kinase PknB [Maioricimonas rarisocia]|uniref:Serine/threonine-protein kinase PknB n=1 Tax=Maioricimonas rarisocia TaxID=2528026 RepID=A0A517ZA84_9PLAN|nr:serine/threonine-protein kinase [Maioricimonas rarisocia]QDU39396.1 Serine/threonine-protein kinase PknB [Maioricimonas rarisocia]